MLVSNRQERLEINEAGVRRLARFVLDAEGAPAGFALSIAFVDEAAIAELNARHLGCAEPTDVLAFPARPEAAPGATAAAWPEPVEGPPLLGEVVVSPAAAIAWCREHGGEPLAEVALYVVHGVLHLVGYDDLDERERARMRARERRLLGEATKAGIALRGRLGDADLETRS